MKKTVSVFLALIAGYLAAWIIGAAGPHTLAQNACVEGDVNGDGRVSVADFNFWKTHFLAGIHPTKVPSGGGVDKIPANAKIMPLGDSITMGMHGIGADWNANKSLRGGYRQRLYELLKANGSTFDFVGSGVLDARETFPDREHEGHGGWCIVGGNGCTGDADPAAGGNGGISGKISQWLSQHQPDVILLHIGTNDFTRGDAVSTVITRYGQLIDQIQTGRPNAFLFVSPVNIVGRTDVNTTFNGQLQQLVTQKAAGGKKIFYVNTYANMAQPIGSGGDTLHPSLANYEVMAQNWFNAMKPHLAGGTVTATPPPATITTQPGDGPVGLTGSFTKIFADEFDSYKSQNWTRTYPWDTSGNERRATDSGTDQIIDPANVSVSGGTLKLTFKKLPAPETINGLTREWSTGMMHTRNKVTFNGDAKGTYIEIRSKPAKGNGLWSHLWLLPNDFASDPNCPVQRYTLKMHSFNGKYPGVAEFNVRGRLSCTLGSNSLSDDSFLHLMNDHTTGFHVYGMDWYPDRIDFYFDGQKVYTSTAIRNNSGPGFLIVNGYVTMVGLNGRTTYPWDSRPDANTPTLTNFEVDYVRAWRRN